MSEGTLLNQNEVIMHMLKVQVLRMESGSRTYAAMQEKWPELLGTCFTARYNLVVHRHLEHQNEFKIVPKHSQHLFANCVNMLSWRPSQSKLELAVDSMDYYSLLTTMKINYELEDQA